MRRSSFLLILSAFVVLPAVQAAAQEAAAPPGPSQELLATWNREAKKLNDMAEDFPENKYDYRPTPEVRTFAEHLLHIAGSNQIMLAAARGEKTPEGHLTREQFKTRAEVAAVVKKSFEDCAAFIQQLGDAGLAKPVSHPFARRTMSQQAFWVGATVNAAEHYGNLVVYYRLNALVPPASRRRSP